MYDYDSLRNFEGLITTDLVKEWFTPNDRGYSKHWVTRIVYEPDIMTKELVFDPVIEFYSVSSFTQFVSSYYVDTITERWGHMLDLMGYEPHWKIEADYMDDIREWALDVAVPYEEYEYY